MTIDFKALKAPFDPSLISWRIGATNKDKTKAIALAYIDARDVMERLDGVCGPGNWQALHPHANGKTSCKIAINVNDPDLDPEWVWKENGSGDSDVEAEKGAFSDSFKRAAVLWGIGRYLYDVENIWVEIEPYGRSYKIKNPNDPKLKAALEKAAKGIRAVKGADEPEEKPKPEIEMMTGEEFVALQKEIKGVKTNEELAEVRNKLTASKPRMSPAQIKTLGAEVSSKGAALVIDEHNTIIGAG